MARFADQMIARFDRTREWPPKSLRLTWDEVARWIAHREADREALRVIAGWRDEQRVYRVDPLAEKISEAFAELIFGQEPVIVPANDRDQELMDHVREENQAGRELKRSEVTCSSEGEVWWRIFADHDAADAPIIEWHSRLGVVPLFIGKKLTAVAFVSRLADVDDGHEAWRLFEIHDRGDVTNVLYRGDNRILGRRVDLTAHPDTENLAPLWTHGIPDVLAGWIPNKLGVDPTRGISDYEGIEDFLLDLNESVTIGAENMRLTAKKRMIVPESAVDDAGNLIAGREVITYEATDKMLGDSKGAGPWRVLEFQFDAQALITYQDSLAVKALTRVGITPQFVGMPTDDGYAASGTALRIRLIPSVNAGNGKAQFWDPELKRMYMLAAQVDRLPYDDGGFGRPWTDGVVDPPSVKRGTTLPEDPAEQATRQSTLLTASGMSRYQAVKEQHPDWTEEQWQEEVKRIGEDVASSVPALPTALPFGAQG